MLHNRWLCRLSVIRVLPTACKCSSSTWRGFQNTASNRRFCPLTCVKCSLPVTHHQFRAGCLSNCKIICRLSRRKCLTTAIKKWKINDLHILFLRTSLRVLRCYLSLSTFYQLILRGILYNCLFVWSRWDYFSNFTQPAKSAWNAAIGLTKSNSQSSKRTIINPSSSNWGAIYRIKYKIAMAGWDSNIREL